MAKPYIVQRFLLQVDTSLLIISSSVTFMDFCPRQIAHCSRQKKNKPQGLFTDTPVRDFSYSFLLSHLCPLTISSTFGFNTLKIEKSLCTHKVQSQD